ncbi:predicted protein, partial [Nematostella vectensis]
GIEEGAREKGYRIMVCFSNESYKNEVENLKVLSNGSVDGLIISIANETLEGKKFNHFHELIKEEIPLVMLDRVQDSIPCDKVIVDDISAGYKATEYLVQTGCKNIAILTTPQHVTVGRLREQGYRKALLSNNLKVSAKLIKEIDESQDIPEQIMSVFNESVDAIFAVNEIYAAIAIKMAKKRNLKVPDDVAVVGFTDGLISEYSSPSITAIVQHGKMMGRQAVEMLIEQIESENNNHTPRTKVVSSNLHIRESSK